MQKKNSGIKFDTIRGDSITFFTQPGKSVNKSLLVSVFTEKEIKQIDKHFNQFYKLVQEHCLNSELKAWLKKMKPGLRLNYDAQMYEEIAFTSLYARLPKDDIPEDTKLELRAKAIMSARIKLFFLADVVIAFVVGNGQILEKLKKRYFQMTGQKLSEEKKKVLIKIINKRNEIKKNEFSSHKFSWKRIIANHIYPHLSDEEKRHLLNLKFETINLPIRLTEHQIKSIAQTIRHHQVNKNIPK